MVSPKPTLHVMVGLQGAGKSTYRALRFGPEVTIVSLDRIGGGKNRRRTERRLILEALEAGRSAVVDNTNPTARGRVRYVALARDCAAHVVAHFIDTPLDRCLKQNAARENKWRVPEIVIQKLSSQLEPPAAAEGFGEIIHARPKDDGTFQVTAP